MITPSSRSQGNWSLFRAIIITIIRMMMRAFIFLESNTCSQLHSAKRMPPQELWLQRPAPHQQSLPWRGELCYKTTTIGLDKYLYPPPLCQRPWRQEILLLRQQTVNEVQSGTYLNSRKRLFFLQPTFSGGSSPTSRTLFASQSPLFGLECWERKSLAITLS